MGNERHVVPDHGGWAVTKASNGRFDSHHATKREAIDRARTVISTIGGGELFVHGRDGRVRDRDTVFSKTPAPTDR